MRRTARPVPFAASAVWTRRSAVIGAALALGAVALSQKGFGVAWALTVLAIGLGFACLAIILTMAAAVVIWRTGRKGGGYAALGFGLALVTLAYPAVLAVKVGRDTPATDLSTDKANPPQFGSKTPAAVAATSSPVLDVAWLLGRSPQSSEVEPITLEREPLAAYRTALKVVTQLHWRVVSATAPTARSPIGTIDASTSSAVMRLPEWIAIRISPEGGQTRIDLRSVATTALPLAGDDPLRNIQAFANAIEDQDADN